MARSPAPIVWDFYRSRGGGASGVGSVLHYYDGHAQTLALGTGITSSDAVIPEGNWEDAEFSDISYVYGEPFGHLSVDHPARGTWYGTAVLPAGAVPGSTDPDDHFYFLRYRYEQDLGSRITEGEFTENGDDPVRTLRFSAANSGQDAFFSASSIDSPGARIDIGIRAGDSSPYPLGRLYLTEIGYDARSDTAEFRACGTIGYFLDMQSFETDMIFDGTVTEITEEILSYFGVDDYAVEQNDTELTLEVPADMTGLDALFLIEDRLSQINGDITSRLWRVAETPTGTVIAGYEDYRAAFLPNTRFLFDAERDVFSYRVSRSAQNAYTRLRVTGTDAEGEELTPEFRFVSHNASWGLGPHRVYHTSADGVTQEELSVIASNNMTMLGDTGDETRVTMYPRPQVICGDYAETRERDGTRRLVGIITKVVHTFGKKGIFTEITAQSGGYVRDYDGRVITRCLPLLRFYRKERLLRLLGKTKGRIQ